MPLAAPGQCPNCGKSNQPCYTLDPVRNYYTCTCCGETYRELKPALAQARAEKKAQAEARRGKPQGSRPGVKRGPYRASAKKATPFRKMPPEKRAAIREMLYRIKVEYYGVEL